MKPLRLLLILALVWIVQGCATMSVNQINQMDFAREGAVYGQLHLNADASGWWIGPAYVVNEETKKRYRFIHGQKGFFVRVPPGTYTIFLESVSRNSYPTRSYGRLNRSSLPIEVELGEVVYVGEIHVTFGERTGPDLSNVGTWVGMAFGTSRSNVKIGYGVHDRGVEKLQALRELRPQNDYQFTKKLVSFRTAPQAAPDPTASVPSGFIDMGIAETIDVSKYRYKVEGNADAFDPTINKLVWYAVPDKETRELLKTKEITLIVHAPDQSIVLRENPSVANELGLLTVEMDLDAITKQADRPGVWTLEVVGPKRSHEMSFEFKDQAAPLTST